MPAKSMSSSARSCAPPTLVERPLTWATPVGAAAGAATALLGLAAVQRGCRRLTSGGPRSHRFESHPLRWAGGGIDSPWADARPPDRGGGPPTRRWLLAAIHLVLDEG